MPSNDVTLTPSFFFKFIEERIKLIENSAEVSDEFELEVELHAERMGKKINQYKEFIKNVRSRANPAVKNAVKSVTEITAHQSINVRQFFFFFLFLF